jgi:LuxR family maltose regulon positive regulatory protein
MLEQTTASQLAVLRGWAHYFLALAHYQTNNLDEALRHLTDLVEHSHTAQAATVRDAASCLALIHSTLGNHEATREIVATLQRIDVEQTGRVSDVSAALEAELLLRQGNVESAARWAEHYAVPVSEGPLLWFMNPHLTQARILLARSLEGDVQDALRILDEVLAIAEATRNARVQIEVLTLRALALDASGDTAEAVAVVRRAVELARPGGHVRVFVDQGPRVHYLLTLLARRGIQPATVRRILDAFPGGKSSISADGRQIRFPGDPFPSQIDTPLAEPLTPREMDVLALLQEPLSVKEIGRLLSVSPETVKRHTINIYAKLGVNSRRDAVARAAALRLLPPR